MNWIGLKHLLLAAAEKVYWFFHPHRHTYVLYLQQEIKIGEYTQPATIDDHRGCTCTCIRCGKVIGFRVVKTWEHPNVLVDSSVCTNTPGLS